MSDEFSLEFLTFPKSLERVIVAEPGVRRTLIVVSALWCLAIICAPLLDLPVVYLFFSKLCHQLPERTWHIHGAPLAACVRCSSIYLGFLVGLLMLRKPSVRRFEAAIMINLGQWIFSLLVSDSEIPRAVAGCLLGIAAAPLVCAGFEEMIIKRVRTANASM